MDKKQKKSLITLLIIATILIALIVGGVIAFNILTKTTISAEDVRAEAAPQDAVLAPDFTVVDKDGNNVRLSDYVGTPIVLNFWASWCPPCKSEMPYFDSQYKQYSEDELVFLMVNFTGSNGETIDSATKYITDEGYSFPIIYDVNFEAVQAYGINAVPMTFFIDKEGYIITGAPGAIDESMLAQGIRMIME